MTTATKKVSKKKISPDVLAQVLREQYLWGFAQVSDLMKTIRKAEGKP